MVARDRVDQSSLPALVERVRRLEAAAPVGFTSITRGGLRIASAQGLVVEGTAITTGTQFIDGEINIAGLLSGDGSIVWIGDASFSGDTSIGGTLDVTGATTLRALTTLLNDLRVQGAGKIVVVGSNTATLQNGELSFDTGGRLAAVASGIGITHGSASIYTVASNAVMAVGSATLILTTLNATVNRNFNVLGDLTVTGAKSFRMPHPTKEGMWLQHSATESPVSGVEYWGKGVLDETGSAVVELPDYFPDLVKPGSITELVTGRGFVADWTDVEDGAFVVSGGSEGQSFSWLIKAERQGGDFLVESEIQDTDLPDQESNSGQ